MAENAVKDVDHLRIRATETVREDGTDRVMLSVFCERRGSSTPLTMCAECSKCHGWELNGRGTGGELVCRVLEEAPPPSFVQGKGMETRISEVMDDSVLCVEPELDIDELIALMLTRKMTQIPVVDARGAPVGIVTKSNLLMRRHLDMIYRHQSNIRQVRGPRAVVQHDAVDLPRPKKVRDVMSEGTFALLESAPIARAAALMAYEETESVVAISQQGAVVGLLTTLHIARWVAECEGFAIR